MLGRRQPGDGTAEETARWRIVLDQQVDTPFPRCVNLTMGDVVPPIANPAGNDAFEFWCLAKPAALMTPAARSARRREEKARMYPDRVGSWR